MNDTIQWFKLRAKTLLKSYQQNNEEAHARIRVVLHDIENVSLQRAQHVVAIEADFANWKALLDAPDLERQLVIVMDKEPLLNIFGFGVGWNDYPRKSIEERRKELQTLRRSLRKDVETVIWTVDWLNKNIRPTKTVRRAFGSYSLKHIAEKQSSRESDRGPRGYIGNGAFIAAAIIAGYPYQKYSGSPNACFGMRKQDIERMIVCNNGMSF